MPRIVSYPENLKCRDCKHCFSIERCPNGNITCDSGICFKEKKEATEENVDDSRMSNGKKYAIIMQRVNVGIYMNDGGSEIPKIVEDEVCVCKNLNVASYMVSKILKEDRDSNTEVCLYYIREV